MKLIYKPWGSDTTTNPRNFPAEYPQDSMRVADTATIPPGWLEITPDAYDNLIATYSAAVAQINAAFDAVPVEVERWKLRAALELNGYLAAVEAAINALPPTQQIVLKAKWAGQETVQRNHPTIIQLGAAIGLTPAQIDNIFIQASRLA